MKAFTLTWFIAALTSCWLEAQDPFEPSSDGEVTEESDSALFSGDAKPADLNSIRGKPIKNLQIMACDQISDISALAGMKLEDVMLWKTNIEDISPLSGMPVKNLVIFGGRVKDLTPLKGMPLESLKIGATWVTDLTPLKGLPLKNLDLYSSEISDLSPLAGMPLECLNLSVFDAGKITDLTPLKGMKLKRLDFHANTITKGMEIIRDMKSLEEINRQKPDPFWKKYDADAPARKRLGELGINYRQLDVTDDGTWSLGFHGEELRDLSVLKGLPIDTLALQKSPITDLSPLEGSKMTCLNLSSTVVKDLTALGKMSLTTLYLNCPEVDDISPLKGLPLETLQLSCPKVIDVSALHGMPLTTLYLTNTNIRDVSKLEGLPLESLFMDIDHIEAGIEVLRRMKSLKRINNQDVEEFWKDHGTNHKAD